MKTTIGMLAILLAVPASAQTVTQGDPKIVTATEFHSPMIIETIFAPADRSLWKHEEWTPENRKPWKRGNFTTAEYYDLGKYSCDGIYFHGEDHRNGTWDSGLLMNVESSNVKDTLVWIEAHFTNPGNVEDTLITLLLEVTIGDDVISKSTMKIKSKQSWRRKPDSEYGNLRLTLPTASLTKDTKLRLTMTTRAY